VNQSSRDFFHGTREEALSITFLSDFGYLESFRSLVPLRCSLSRLGQSLAHVKFLGPSTPYGLKYTLPKKCILVSPNSHVIPIRYVGSFSCNRYVSLFGNRCVRLHGLGFIQVFRYTNCMNTYVSFTPLLSSLITIYARSDFSTSSLQVRFLFRQSHDDTILLTIRIRDCHLFICDT